MFLALEKKRTMADWKTGKPKWMNFNQSGWNRIILRDDSTLTTTTLCLLMCWTLKLLLKYLFQECGNLLSSDHRVLNVQLFSRAILILGKRISGNCPLPFCQSFQVSMNLICQFFLSIVSGFQFASKTGKIHDTLWRPIEEAVLHLGTKIISHLAILLSIS